MNLYEEYCHRHELRCPVIKRADTHLNMIFRADPKTWLTHWVVFQISQRRESYHPSFYNFSWLIPHHNGFSAGGGSLRTLSDPIRVDWDNYDIEIIKAAQRDDGIQPLVDLSEAKMAAWEMFLYCGDDSLRSLPPAIRYQICESIDLSKSIEERMQLQDSILQFLHSSGSRLGSCWDSIRSYCDPGVYATWFADLVLQMRDLDYRNEFSDLQSVA